MKRLKNYLKVAPAVVGVIGGVAAQGAVVLGAINPKAGAILTGVALISAALGKSLLQLTQAVEQIEGQ